MGRAPKAFMQPAAAGGHRFYLHHLPEPGRPVRGALLHLHPWAEEMNKSRRMAALASRAFSDAGCAVLRIDLWGCGDSGGDFGDATWDGWIDDAVAAARWLQAAHPEAPLWLWGLRCGALLARALAERLEMPAHLLLWQPALQGKMLLQQFLRLKVAAQLADGGGKAAMAALRQQVDAGQPIEVAGYVLNPALARGLEGAQLDPLPLRGTRDSRLVWLETSTQDVPTLTPAGATALARWQAAGWRTSAAAVAGPAFWQTTEIEEAPELIRSSVDALADHA
jgi:exosortase A-associated hydrolase 2